MMKTKILMWLLSSIALGSMGQDVITSTRTVEKSFGLDDRDRLEVENKYGDVIFEAKETNELTIRAEITLTGGGDRAITELEDYVQVEIEKNGTFIVAETIWGKNASFFSKSWKEIKNAFDGDRTIEVNYFIEGPSTLDLTITNKFGDVYVDRHEGRLSIDLSHGDLRSRQISIADKVSVSYGRMIVDEWGSGRVKLQFGNMESKSAKDLTIDSRNSDIDLESAENLKIISQNDTWNLGKIRSVNGEFRFSNARLDEVSGNLMIKQHYGDLRLDLLSREFETADIQMKRSDVTIVVEETTSFNFSVYLMDGETFSSVPELVTLERDQQVGDERQMEGYWKAPHPQRKLNVRGESAVVKLAKK